MNARVSDFSLRFASEAEALAVAAAINVVMETEAGPRLARFTHVHAADVIGELPGVEGWHVNCRMIGGAPLPAPLEPYVIHPASPDRVWA